MVAPRAVADDGLLLSLDACIADAAAREAAEAAADDEPDEDPEEPGPSELESYCPEVHAALGESPLGPYLEPDWEHRISASKLERLRSLLAEPPLPAARALDTGSIAGIVERVRTAQVERERSLWQRFKDWVRRLVEHQAQSEDSAWFEEWLREHWPSDRVMKVFAYGILALLVGGLGWIAWIELRAAGVSGRWRRGGDVPDGAAAAAGAAGPPRSLAGASDAEVPGILIALLLDQLRRLGRLQDRRGMTHRELGRAAQFESTSDGEAFLGLLQLSERLRYAPTAPPAAGARTVVDGARRLLDALTRQSAQAA